MKKLLAIIITTVLYVIPIIKPVNATSNYKDEQIYD